MGTPLSEVAKRVAPGPYPFLAALVNNRIKELYYKIYTPVSVRFVDITSFSGIRVYQRTSWFILQKAVRDLFPGKTLHIRHSMGQNGFYCEVEGIDEFSHEQAAALEGRMRYLVAQDLPISRMKILTSEGPRPLCGPGAHRQDRPAGHPPAALQRPLYARRHRRLFLRRAGALNGLHRPVRHRTLLQRVLPRPAAAHGARPAQHERRAGKDVRHLPGIPVLGADHGSAHRGRRQLQGCRGRRGRVNNCRGIPRTQVRVGRRHDLRRQHLARRAHGAHLGPLVERQEPPPPNGWASSSRAGAAPGIVSARRLLRLTAKRPRATPTAITTTRHSKPSTSACSTTTSAA